MSEQMPDWFHYNGKDYSLESIEFPRNLKVDIEQFGLNPVCEISACWRGYILTFAISDNKLVFDQINTNNGDRKDNKIPLINGNEPKISKPDGLLEEYKDFRRLDYEDIKLPVPKSLFKIYIVCYNYP